MARVSSDPGVHAVLDVVVDRPASADCGGEVGHPVDHVVVGNGLPEVAVDLTGVAQVVVRVCRTVDVGVDQEELDLLADDRSEPVELCRHAEAKLNVPLGGTTADGAVTIEQVFCLGNCALSPAMMVGEKLYGRVDPERFDEIIAGLEKEAAE